MEKKEFDSLNVARINNDDVAALFEMTIKVSTPLKDVIGELPEKKIMY